MKGIIEQVLENGNEVTYGDIPLEWQHVFTDLKRPYIPDNPQDKDGYYYLSGYNKRRRKESERWLRLYMGLRLPMDIFITKYDRTRRRKR